MDAHDPLPKSAELVDVPTTDQKENVGFEEDVSEQRIEYDALQDRTFYRDSTAGDDLAEFLSRPVEISNFEWQIGGFSTFQLSPWDLFFNDARVKRKLDNYAFINCNLHVKVVINSSPFLYGALMMAYTPLPKFAPTVDVNAEPERVTYSQRPHVLMYPHHNQGGHMTLPFVFHKNWLQVPDRQQFVDMGRLDIIEMSPLRSANDQVTSTATITFYAWASNVRVTGPTVALALQSGKAKSQKKPVKVSPAKDEYGQGIISKPASAIATLAGYAKEIPYLAPFATATQIGASAVASIASMFGYTNVPVISDTMPFKSLPFPNLASAEIGSPVDKLTLDPKNELCLDPRTVGIAPQDELDLSYLCSRESYLVSFDWDESDSPSDLKFASEVTPNLVSRLVVIPANVYSSTPMHHFSSLFRYWRGDIIFRFRVVASPYHKGRLRITWDPVGDAIVDPVSTTVAYTKIVDVNEDTNVEIRVPYLQARQWLNVQPDLATAATNYTPPGASGTLLSNPNFNNGVINLRVLNKLVSPSVSAPVRILVFVRAAENFELADPNVTLPTKYSYFQLQSGKGAGLSMAPSSGAEEHDEQYVIYMGENVKSLRTLLRRSTFTECVVPAVDSQIPFSSVTVFHMTKYPGAPGFDPNGTIPAIKQIPLAVGNAPANFTKQTPFTWIVPCFLGMRGSMIWHFNAESFYATGKNMTNVTIERVDKPLNTFNVFSTDVVESYRTDKTFTSNTILGGVAMSRYNGTGTGGLSVVNQETQSGLSAGLPHYNPYRFVSARPEFYRKGSAEQNTDRDTYELRVINRAVPGNRNLYSSLVLNKYHSIGTDFTVFFFLGVPTIYEYPEELVVPN